MSQKGTRIWAVVPIKAFAQAKMRLAALLRNDQRQLLAQTMLRDVLDTLTQCHALSGIIVVTADTEAARIATSVHAHVLAECGGGLNEAVLTAAAHIEKHIGAAALLVVPGDVPHVSVHTLEAAINALHHPGSAVLARATRDGGTNLFGCNPASALAPSFGPDSFYKHVTAAEAQGLRIYQPQDAELRLDLDEPSDLHAFMALNSKSQTDALLRRWNVSATESYPPPCGEGRREASGWGFRSEEVCTTRVPTPDPSPQGGGESASTHSGARMTSPDDRRPSVQEALALATRDDVAALMRAAAERRDQAHGSIISYSRKVFIPLTKLCRDVCHYCTFAQPPRKGERAYLSLDEVLAIARAGAAAGCKEALFTLGDKPELRYRAARNELDALGHATTLSYLAEAARRVIDETGLLPHANPGLLDTSDIAALRKVSVSQGIMLESGSERLCARGMPHHGSPDKHPALRLETIRLAGEAQVPFTSGLLIGIGETRLERIEAMLALRDLNDAHGHIQEIIIQNFRPKPDTRMAHVPAPALEDHLWTIAVARLIFDPQMNIQAPPNLSDGHLGRLVEAGINDWGGVSPVTPDHVNPEAPWPHLQILERATAAAGKQLTERLAIYPTYMRDWRRWLDPGLHTRVLRMVDAEGRPRIDAWSPGTIQKLPPDASRAVAMPALRRSLIAPIIARAEAGGTLSEGDITRLFESRGDDFTVVCSAADGVRESVSGNVISYVVTRNINYTNICGYRCQFCAFSKGKMSENLRGKPYNLPLEEIGDRVHQAWARGATEVCMQGGIHPDYTGGTYLAICRAVKAAVPSMHVHAFSPLEVFHGAATLNLSLDEFLASLKSAGLGTLPGTAAEILDDDVRAHICPDKISTQQWLDVMRAAHHAGLRSTATIMFGHVDGYVHWARHLMRVRTLQAETGGFTEFVPLPFVHMEAPIYLKGRARPGPTFREAVLMHAVARLALHPLIPNIQTSWVKMGREGVKVCLRAGANDLGGTLMDETITRSAGAEHGQEMTPQAMEAIITDLRRIPRQRTTLYTDAPEERALTAFSAHPRAIASPLEQRH